MNNTNTVSMCITSGLNEFEECFMKMLARSRFRHNDPKGTGEFINNMELTSITKYIWEFQKVLINNKDPAWRRSENNAGGSRIRP